MSGKKAPNIRGSQRLWTVDDMAELFNVRPRTVYDWVYRGSVPFIKVNGSLLRFEPGAIEKWLGNNATAKRRLN